MISFLVLLSAVLGLVAAPTAYAAPPPPAPAQPECKGPFYNNDQKLGPKDLPESHSEVGKLLDGYHRFGDEPNPPAFLVKYWNPQTNKWKYPDNDGFVEKPQPKETLKPGTRVDRFGAESGSFLAPLGTLYVQRSIPPDSLNTCQYEPGVWKPNGYYQYEVKKDIVVYSGTTAKYYGQPGGGKQYQTSKHGEHPRVNVDMLVKDGSLVRIN